MRILSQRGLVLFHYHYDIHLFLQGARLISPEQQQEVADIFQACGWNEPPQFDAYVEDYAW